MENKIENIFARATNFIHLNLYQSKYSSFLVAKLDSHLVLSREDENSCITLSNYKINVH